MHPLRPAQRGGRKRGTRRRRRKLFLHVLLVCSYGDMGSGCAFALRFLPWCSPLALGILAGMDQKESFAATQRPRSSSTAAVACLWRFCWYYSPRAVLPWVFDRPKMPDILVGMDQMDSLTWRLLVLLVTLHVRCCPHAGERSLPADDFALRAVISTQDAKHGRYGPASRSTEIWASLEVDFCCAAWFNSGYTLTRQSRFLPAVTCSVFTLRSTEFRIFLEVDLCCAAWFNGGYTLTRQSGGGDCTFSTCRWTSDPEVVLGVQVVDFSER